MVFDRLETELIDGEPGEKTTCLDASHRGGIGHLEQLCKSRCTNSSTTVKAASAPHTLTTLEASRRFTS